MFRTGFAFASAVRLVSLAAALACLPWTASGQYFGQNKVRYRTYDFKVLKTEHFDIHYYDEIREAAVQFGRMAERWNARLEKILDHQLSSRQPVVLYGSHADFRGTTVLPDYIGETTGGVTEALRRRLIMPLSSSLADTDHVLGHELVHAFQFDIGTRAGPMGGSALPGVLRLPLWFVEGMAEYLSLGPVDPQTAMWMRDAVARKALPDIRKLDDPQYFPYRWGQAFWAFVAGRYGDEIVGRIFKAAGRAGQPEGAITSTLGVSLEELSKQWHQELIEAYRPAVESRKAAEAQARPLAAERAGPGRLNVGPVLSPDGRHLVYFSERDLFSIDMFLADAATGKVLGRITQTAVDPHFDSLQFATASGAWSADGSRFAFGAIVRGRPYVSIYDLASRRVTRRIPLTGLDDVFGLTWSPDGREIAFSGMAGGYTDLYVLPLEGGALRRLTNDPYTELTPAWSPDGQRIAFSTDRFTSDLEELSFGDLRLALIRPDGSGLEALPAFRTGKHLGPQWAEDGKALYFAADYDGVPNVVRLEPASGTLRQVTDLSSGVTGISRYSPSFSAALKAQRIAFTAFENSGYRIYLMDGEQALVGRPLTAAEEAAAAILPPRERKSQIVRSFLGDTRTGLLDSSGFRTEPYRPRLSLDYVAPPNVTVGAGNFGPFLGGGTAFYWSDLLGYHNLMTAIQSTTTTEGVKFYNNLSGIVAYQNQKTRWNWGFTGGQIPYMSGSYEQTLAVVGGQPVVVDTSIRSWQIAREISAVFSRPYSRAQRVELSLGYQNISYDADALVQVYSAVTGALLFEQRAGIETPPALNMAVGRAALVYDTSIFGGTSPVAGQSYRLEFGTVAGSMKYTTVLADYRKYLRFARTFTLAGRLLHYGRYGWDAEDPRQQEIYAGYPTLVRGYSAESFAIQECGPDLQRTGACPVYDRLFGSRIAVANAELRVPLLGFLGVIPSRSAPPVEGAVFYDAGVAWRSGELANLIKRPRKPVSSYGGTLRFNVLGFFIAQLSYVKPLQRPLKPWHWEFSITPGF